jgi:deoxycytidine triphosphate deaminase
MPEKVLVITGTEAAGKTTVVDALVANGKAELVVAVTTRDRRADDMGRYSYKTLARFEKHEADGDLVVSTEYRGKRYGILRTDLQKVLSSGKLAVLTLTPASVGKFLQDYDSETQVLSVFIDADDSALDERVVARGGSPDPKRRELDRTFRSAATYSLSNRNINDTVAAVELLLAGQGRSGILPHQWISGLLKAGMLLEEAEVSGVQAASYDLRLGDEYFYGGRIKRLSSTNPILTIEPYDYAIVTSKERARMPNDVAGRFDLSVGLFSQGVILSNGPQIDPGFEGNLFCLLLNTSSSPVLLRRGHHYATLEMSRMLESSDKPYAGDRQGKGSILDYLPSNAARGAINELKRELEQLRKESSRLQTFFIAALSLMFAVSALLAATR